MAEVPKIVHDRLRATAAQTGPGQNASELKHPGADLLTAFAEQSLSLSERESLLEHLAGCGDCREVVILALPEADAIVSAPAETQVERTTAVAISANRGWLRSGAFSWVNLRWATLAAAVVVVAAVLALRPGSQNDNQAKLTPTSASPPTSAPADVERQIAMATPSAGLAKEDLARKDLGKAELAQADRLRSVPQTRSALKSEAGQLVSNLDLKANQDLSTEAKRAPAPPPALNEGAGMFVAGTTNGLKKDSERADRPATAGASGARLAVTNGSSTGQNTETVELESAAAAVPPEPSVVGGLMARDEAPAVEKAKPATQELDANATASSDARKTPVTDVPNAHKYSAGDFAYRNATLSKAAIVPKATWAITAGVLRRSLDGGQTWESALQADHPLQCYVLSGRDVWAGGQAGTLLHSPDGGATWTKVHPSFKEQTLTSDVTHIDAPGVGKITVSAGDKEIKETWSSADGGLTWEKK
ncbi:MAG TPA: zf-HC2 domain-containing protein [Terriglobales bacterium]|nr:zf-HC2 domain-containing protein [Terriglobales bacterium]